VEDQGIVEFEVRRPGVERVEALRPGSGGATVIVDEREPCSVVTIHCSHPGELAASLGSVLPGTSSEGDGA